MKFKKIDAEHLLNILIILFFTLSYYEGYINEIFFPLTKLIIFPICLLIFFIKKGKLYINKYLLFFVFWFIYNIISLLWGYSDDNGIIIVNTHFYSIFTIIFLLLAISSFNFNYNFINTLVNSIIYLGISISTLALFYSKPYIDEIYSARLTLTIYNIQVDPNDLASVFIFSILISINCLFIEKTKKIISIINITLSSLALLNTSSRGGLLTIIFILFYTFYSILNKHNIKYYLKYILGFIFIFYILIKLTPSESINRLFFNDYGDGSGRLIFWKEAINLSIDNLFFGVGWGGHSIRIHNTFLNILLNNGVIGLILFISPLLIILYKSIKKKILINQLLIIYIFIIFFFIDGITKRFFWNAIILSIIYLNHYKYIKK